MGSGDDAAADPRSLAPANPPPLNEAQLAQADRTLVPGERVGLIRPGMPMAQIENLYGSENLKSRKVEAGAGGPLPGYLLFPGSSDELEIALGENKQPAYVTITNPRSSWAFPSGVTIGTTLSELNTLNGKPFRFTGFGRGYGGTVTDWQEGKLAGLFLRMTYSPERLPAEGLDGQLYGDQEIVSDLPQVQHLGVRVREIRVDITRAEEAVD